MLGKVLIIRASKPGSVLAQSAHWDVVEIRVLGSCSSPQGTNQRTKFLSSDIVSFVLPASG